MYDNIHRPDKRRAIPFNRLLSFSILILLLPNELGYLRHVWIDVLWCSKLERCYPCAIQKHARVRIWVIPRTNTVRGATPKQRLIAVSKLDLHIALPEISNLKIAHFRFKYNFTRIHPPPQAATCTPPIYACFNTSTTRHRTHTIHALDGEPGHPSLQRPR